MTTNFESPQALLDAARRVAAPPISAPPTGSRSPRTRSTSSPTPRSTTSGSTSTPSGPRPGPFGTPIAHGFLTMSLAAYFLRPAGARVRTSRWASTTALDKVRFPVAGSGRLEGAGQGRAARGQGGAGRRAGDGPHHDRARGRRQAGRDRRHRSAGTSHERCTTRSRSTGKVAIVTGAGRGIGAQTAKTYAEAGADVVLAARTKEQLDEVAEDVRGFGRRGARDPVPTPTTTKRSKSSSRRRSPSSAASTSW